MNSDNQSYDEGSGDDSQNRDYDYGDTDSQSDEEEQETYDDEDAVEGGGEVIEEQIDRLFEINGLDAHRECYIQIMRIVNRVIRTL